MLTITTQGSFVSDGTSHIVTVPQGIDWFKVFNYSVWQAQTLASGYEFTWLRGMPINEGLIQFNTQTAAFDFVSASAACSTAPVSPGFILFDSTTQLPSVQVVVAACSNNVAPVITTANTLSLVPDQTVIRIYGYTTAESINGIDYTVTAVTPATNFTLPTHATAIPADAGSANSNYRVISYDPSPMFYPTNRTIINISQAVNAVVTTSVVHQYTVGQKVRLMVPSASYGMVEANNLLVTVTVASAATPTQFTCNLDTTGFTAFTWPTTLATRQQLAQVIPVGEECSNFTPASGYVPPYASLSFFDATENKGIRGMLLGAGAMSPAGVNTNIIYWQAGKVENL